MVIPIYIIHFYIYYFEAYQERLLRKFYILRIRLIFAVHTYFFDDFFDVIKMFIVLPCDLTRRD